MILEFLFRVRRPVGLVVREDGGSGPYDGGRWNEFWSDDVILGFLFRLRRCPHRYGGGGGAEGLE